MFHNYCDIDITNNISVCNNQFFNFKKNCFDRTICQIRKRGVHVLSERGQSLLIADCCQTSCFPRKLEESNTGSVGLTHSTGLSARPYLHSIPEGCTLPTGVQSGTAEGHGIRGTRDDGQGGYRISQRNTEPTTVHIKHVPGTQERGPVQTRYKPQSSKSIIRSQHFKMEGIQMLKDLLRPGDWLAKVDLKDAYFTIPIHHDHRAFLRFQHDDWVFQFTCLPFSLSSTPWVFTKTLRPAIALLRELGLRLIVYIDILVMAESKEILRDLSAGKPGVPYWRVVRCTPFLSASFTIST